MPRPDLPDATALLASLLAQMTRFSCLGCPQLAAHIKSDLALFRNYPDEAMPPALKRLARRLEKEWTQLHESLVDEPPGADPAPLSLHPASQSLH